MSGTVDIRGSWLVRIAITGLFLSGLLLVARQPSAEPIPVAAKATPEMGLAMVRDTNLRLLGTIEKEDLDIDADRDRVYELVDEVVFSNFDFHRMSARILGKGWRAATPEQKREFIDEFKLYLLNTYASALGEYNGQEIEYLPVRTRQARAIKVQTRVLLTQAAPIEIDYVLSLSRDGSWKVVDTLVEGISLVVTHRASFRMQVRQKGLPGLIAELKAHNHKKTGSPDQP